MFDWLNKLLESLITLIPRLIIVNRTHEGVKFRGGKTVIPMKPGLHVYWPLVTEIFQYPVVRHTHDLKSQSLTTGDGKDIVISISVVCEIHDIVAALAENFDVNETVSDIARGVVAEIILTHDFKEIVTWNFESEISESLYEYGMTVLAVKITEFSRCRTIRLNKDL